MSQNQKAIALLLCAWITKRQHAVDNRQAIVKLSLAKKNFASHDGATVEHVIKAISKRIVLAEFPLI
ncbi:MAG: hypothetical protein AAGM46_00140 [Cyanobacteria bacterium J06582_2]